MTPILLLWQGSPVPTPVPDAIVSDGKGSGANIVYKRHKKVHDEIEDYFALLGQDEADEIVEEARAQVANPIARDAVVASIHQRAVARVVKLIKAQRDAEIKLLLEIAQDEDDAEAAIVLMAMH